jgi:hypothetical protein
VAQQYPAPGAQRPPGSEIHLFVKAPGEPCP